MAAAISREVFAQRQLETALLEDLLTRVEQQEYAILTKLRCPTYLPDIYAILARERPTPWPKRTAATDKTRALHAMRVLALISQTRSHIASGQENPRLAAHSRRCWQASTPATPPSMLPSRRSIAPFSSRRDDSAERRRPKRRDKTTA